METENTKRSSTIKYNYPNTDRTKITMDYKEKRPIYSLNKHLHFTFMPNITHEYHTWRCYEYCGYQ